MLEMIDLARVEELRVEVGADDFQEVVDLFLEEVQEVVDRLSAAPDPALYQADMHFLKGSALNLGFADFAKLCAAAEQAARAGEVDKIDVGSVVRCYRLSRAEFLQKAGVRQVG